MGMLGILFSLLFLVALVGCAVWLSVWAIEDAKLRGKSPAFVWIAAVLFFPWGLIAWILFRPEPQQPNGPKRAFHLEDYRVQ